MPIGDLRELLCWNMLCIIAGIYVLVRKMKTVESARQSAYYLAVLLLISAGRFLYVFISLS